jgi:hypothetical protein
MPSYVPAKYGTEYIFYVGLDSVATAGAFQANPTIASGDFKISKDGGNLANLTTLPTVTPASGKLVKVTLSSAEMDADNVTVIASDASGGEWRDLIINIQTAARQIDDLAYPTTSGRSIDVTTGGEVGIDWANVGNPTTTLNLSGTTVKTATDVEADTQDIQSRIPAALVGGRIDANVGAISSDATAADNAEAFFDGTGYAGTNNVIPTVTTVTNLTNAPTSGDLTATMKASVRTEATAATPSVTVSDKTGFSLSNAGIQAIWDALTSALTTVGSIGKLLADNINATISSRSSHTAANVRTEMDSNSTQLAKLGTPAGASMSADIAAVKSDTAAILADTGTDGVVVASGSKTGYSLAADQSAVTVGTVNDLGTTARGRVNAEVLDVLNVDTFAEPSAVPAATSTLVAKIQWMFALARNKLTQNATTQTLRNDADSASIGTSTVSDDGTTMTRGEWS